MTRKEIAVQFTSALVGAAIASVLTFTATASIQGEKIAVLERQVAAKADAGAVVELATKHDVKELGTMISNKITLHEKRDDEQDARFLRIEDDAKRAQELAKENERTLRRLENKLDVLIAIADPDGRVGRTVGRSGARD